ncbi:MAG: hypothetical protein K2N87_04560 [Eubacterium sp.]|nr:hypothetical protein [Eubacterium sp.]
MIGKFQIVIHDSRVRYELELERKITIIKGNSGTGKTTLYELVYDLKRQRQSFIKCIYENRVMALTEENWKSEITKYENRFLFVDEGLHFVSTLEFAEYVQKSGNFFVIISRSGRLKWLPYSVNSIFEITGEKRGSIMFNRLFARYAENHDSNINPALVITEDAKSGYQMMNYMLKCGVEPASGNGNIKNMIHSYSDRGILCVIADGAAFGAFVGEVSSLLKLNGGYLYTPESFEFMLLHAKAFQRYLGEELTETYQYCDFAEFSSWERYYTDLLNRLCSKFPIQSYSKHKLDDFFYEKQFTDVVKEFLSDLDASLFAI